MTLGSNFQYSFSKMEFRVLQCNGKLSGGCWGCNKIQCHLQQLTLEREGGEGDKKAAGRRGRTWVHLIAKVTTYHHSNNNWNSIAVLPNNRQFTASHQNKLVNKNQTMVQTFICLLFFPLLSNVVKCLYKVNNILLWAQIFFANSDEYDTNSEIYLSIYLHILRKSVLLFD